ncbi:MAG: acetate kinase [Armatimonadota bacterium]|nr:acetate kinase [Armatimonadota bacterium]
MNVLVVNCGSSSLKYELYDMEREQSLANGLCERLGTEGANIEHETHDGRTFEQDVEMPDHRVALGQAVDVMTDDEHGVIGSLEEIDAVGHRVVHGGEEFASSVLIDEDVEAAIDRFGELAPLHNPPNLLGIQAARELLPHVPHVAVFDTAFHQTMPPHAFVYGLPWEMYAEHGIRRYGFHGTSHRYVSLRAGQYLQEQGIPVEDHKIVTCHLGNGCSMAAVKAGECIDTTMGYTPLEGLVMGTRCGDIDPAIVLYMAQNLGMSLDEIDHMLQKHSGLLGLSGVSNDMRDIQSAAAGGNDRARLTLDLFAYKVRKYIGAYAAVLEGLDCVVLTGGIGENDHLQRRWCVQGLEHLGIVEDPDRNLSDLQYDDGIAPIGMDDAPGHLLVIQTDEELMIARDTMEVLSAQEC